MIVERGRHINIFSVYNPAKSVHKNEFKHYIQQLGSSYIMLGDFNAHSKLISSKCVRPNVTGNSIEALVMKNDVCFNNQLDFYTYISPSLGRRSCLDLCFSSPYLAPVIDINRLHDVGSDHFPVSVMVQVKPLLVSKVAIS